MMIRNGKFSLDDFVKNILAATQEFPQEHVPGCGYWRMLLPASACIDSEETPDFVRQVCAQTLINRAAYLRQITPRNGNSTRVVAMISLPELFDSQIIVFFGSEYCDSFFHRNTPFQQWIPLPDERSLIWEWNLGLPGGSVENGYREVIRDIDYMQDGEVWFIGELIGQ